MKIFVIGSHGMLGRYVTMYLKKFYTVIEVNRDVMDAAKANLEDVHLIMRTLDIQPNDVIINCAGIIKPAVVEVGELNTILVDAVFPRLLATVAENEQAKMIHPSTDCVFDGKDGNYNENSPTNATDIYGKAKALGEPPNCSVIRTSIVGEEVNKGRSLIEWVKRNHDKEIPGYTNHLFNGITCYQFAKICKEIIDKNLFWDGVRHIFSPSILTKFELVELINAIYSLNIKVKPKDTPLKNDKSFTSVYEPIVQVPSLGSQIAELREVEFELYGTNVAE